MWASTTVITQRVSREKWTPTRLHRHIAEMKWEKKRLQPECTPKPRRRLRWRRDAQRLLTTSATSYGFLISFAFHRRGYTPEYNTSRTFYKKKSWYRILSGLSKLWILELEHSLLLAKGLKIIEIKEQRNEVTGSKWFQCHDNFYHRQKAPEVITIIYTLLLCNLTSYP